MLKFGTSNIGKVFAGTSAVAGAYSGNNLIWTNITSPDTVFNVSKMTSDVYDGSTTYNNCKFLAFRVIPFDNETGEVEFDGIIKQVTGTSVTDVIFGQYGSGADDGTADVGDIIFRNIKEIQGFDFNEAKATSNYYNKINSIKNWGNLQIVGKYLFINTNLTSITLGNNITAVDTLAFITLGIGASSSLTSLKISKSVIDMGYPSSILQDGTSNDAPFLGANKNLYITVDSNNLYFSAEDGSLYDKNKTILYRFCQNDLNSFTIPNSVTTIQAGAFNRCSLTNVNLNNVTKINCYAFGGVSPGGNLTLDGDNLYGVTEIGGQAFSSSYLTSIKFSPNLSKIGLNAFSNCSKLTNIEYNGYIGSTMSQSVQAFNSTKNLNIVCNAPVASYFFSATTNTTTLTIASLTLNTNSIQAHAFRYANFLENATISLPSATYGTYAFQGGKIVDANNNDSLNISVICAGGTVNDYCFETFKNISSFKFSSTTVPSGSYASMFGPTSSLTSEWKFYVPNSALSTYQSTWSSLSSYIAGY